MSKNQTASPPSGNKASGGLPDKLSIILNARPEKRTAFFYQAIILAIAAHIFVFALIYFSTAMPGLEANETDAEPALEEMELEFVEEEELQPEDPAEETMSEEVRDLIANSQSIKTGSQVSYTGKTRAEMEAEVEQNLKGLEAEEFDRLKSSRSDVSEPAPDKADPKQKDNKNAERENYDWFKKQSEKSYSGPVSAEFNLPGRITRSTARPTYRCKSAGKVVVQIEVDQTGNVTSATVDEAKSTGNDCIREESRDYALKWKFDYKTSAPKKQNGTITFTFSAQ